MRLQISAPRYGPETCPRWKPPLWVGGGAMMRWRAMVCSEVVFVVRELGGDGLAGFGGIPEDRQEIQRRGGREVLEFVLRAFRDEDDVALLEHFAFAVDRQAPLPAQHQERLAFVMP